MKNAIVILFAIILSVSIVYADEGVQEFNYGQDINISDVVANSTGQPCLSCTCNITVFYAEHPSVKNVSYIMTNVGNGQYKTQVNKLNINYGWKPR